MKLTPKQKSLLAKYIRFGIGWVETGEPTKKELKELIEIKKLGLKLTGYRVNYFEEK